MKTGRYSLAQLLDNDSVEQIIIPEIQRDYVWTTHNVDGLMNSIEANFSRKVSINLNITECGEAVDGASLTHLIKEYERLKFNTRIGFIYAYYDASDSRILYLIDGQQRITTLFLLLLAAYSRGDEAMRAEFRRKYFRNSLPKLDYRVRENAHTYLVDFIDFVLANPNADFNECSPRYYSDYANDPTIQSIHANYARIVSRIDSLAPDTLELIDYVENFIEFNYFDTGLSRQGERLYLYMNSRGESLSVQENIRPTIISRCANDQKISAGRRWEIWQNFFWQHRGEQKNSDAGFRGFLKVAVILHQAKFDFNDWEEFAKTDIKGRLKTKREVREAFISENFSDIHGRWVVAYINGHKNFDLDWLARCFDAYSRLSSMYDAVGTKHPYQFIGAKDWRSGVSIKAINYVSICGLMQLLLLNPQISDENLYRFAMYVLNRCDDPNNFKVPDTATLRVMEFAKQMEAINWDVRLAMFIVGDHPYFDCTRMLIWRHINSPEWEHLFWELTADDAINSFFRGNHDILILLADESANADLISVERTVGLFKEKLLNIKTSRDLRKSLLNYGKISISGGNDAWISGRMMKRHKLPANDDANNNEWLTVLGGCDGRDVVRRYLLSLPPSPDGTLQALSKALHYMAQYRYLCDAPDGCLYPDIIVQERVQAKENLMRSLPAYLLATKLPLGWNWWGDHRYAVVNFIVEDNSLQEVAWDAPAAYALDFVYNWTPQRPYWQVFLKKRNNIAFLQDEIEALADWNLTNDATKMEYDQQFVDTRGYNPDGTLDSVESIVAWYSAVRQALAQALRPS